MLPLELELELELKLELALLAVLLPNLTVGRTSLLIWKSCDDGKERGAEDLTG